MLRRFRIIIALLVMCSITLFFLNVIDSFGILAKMQFIPSLLAANILSILFLFIITLLFGRIYCSVLCPLGIMQDIVSWFSRKLRKNKKPFTYRPAWTKLRYTVLTIVVLAFFIGFALIPAALDPYSIYGRLVTHLLSPVWTSINNLLAIPSDRYGLYIVTRKTIYLKSIEALIISIVSLLLISFMAWKHGRLYCNTICPAGTMLGTLSRFSICKVSIDADKCNHCGLCAANCKSSCIDSKEQKIDYSRCINCFDCVGNCRQKAITFTTPFSKKQTEKKTEDSNMAVSRRQFMLTSVISMASALAFITKASASSGVKVTGENLPILPPGSKSNINLSTHCISCHLCVSKCPNQVLKPMSLDYGISMQPAMDFKKGYCDYDCNLCGRVCPNHAIGQLSLEQKQNTKIGYAVYYQFNCVVETDNVNCGNCAIHCPTQAITMVDYKDKKIPSIDLSRCIGCGSCQYHCPANPNAIHVVGFAEHK